MKSKRGEKNKLKLEEQNTLLSNERTLLSYIRTTFSALILGFALIQLAGTNQLIRNIGIVTLVGGFVIGILGMIEYRLHKKTIKAEAEE